jgi:hypothetical protein
MLLPMNLVKYTPETEEPTEAGIYPYFEEQAEDTLEWNLTREEALWEADERARLGNPEAEGVWLLVAAKLGSKA